MSVNEVLSEEIQSTPGELLREDKTLTYSALEKVWTRDWNSAEEDKAWKNL